MALFLSTYTHRVDKKRRVSVPATFRAALAASSPSGIVGFPAPGGVVRCAGYDLMERIAAEQDRLAIFSGTAGEALDMAAKARPMAIDSDGRIQIDAELAAHAGIDDTAVFTGRLNYFEIAAPAGDRS